MASSARTILTLSSGVVLSKVLTRIYNVICVRKPANRRLSSTIYKLPLQLADTLVLCIVIGEKLRREWLSGRGVVDAQLDAYVSGGGEWATGGDDDDDYEDACVAETWRDGGVLSEADA